MGKPFDMKKFRENYEGDDLGNAILSNGLGNSFAEGDIQEIIAEVCGENDGYDWWWIVGLKDGKYALLKGGCDYTGWDCQSYLDVVCIKGSVDECVNASPEVEDNGDRRIRENLKNQVDSKQPFATYIEDSRKDND